MLFTRPRILVAAAKSFAKSYKKPRNLPAKYRNQNRRNLINALKEDERRLEDQRLGLDADYSVTAHVTVLGALFVELPPLGRRRAQS